MNYSSNKKKWESKRVAKFIIGTNSFWNDTVDGLSTDCSGSWMLHLKALCFQRNIVVSQDHSYFLCRHASTFTRHGNMLISLFLRVCQHSNTHYFQKVTLHPKCRRICRKVSPQNERENLMLGCWEKYWFAIFAWCLPAVTLCKTYNHPHLKIFSKESENHSGWKWPPGSPSSTNNPHHAR